MDSLLVNNNMGNPDRIRYLLIGFIRRTLTTKEDEELDAWVNANDENMQLFENFTDENCLEENLRFLGHLDTSTDDFSNKSN